MVAIWIAIVLDYNTNSDNRCKVEYQQATYTCLHTHCMMLVVCQQYQHQLQTSMLVVSSKLRSQYSLYEVVADYDVTNSGPTWYVIVELQYFNFKMRMKYVELESKIQFLFYDIIIIHFLISYLVKTCCSLVWYLDTQCCGPVSLGTGPVTPNAGSVTLYTFPVLTISVRYYGVYYRYQLIFLHCYSLTILSLSDWLMTP